MNQHFYGLILAGGRGTRFWPRSRKRSAKQVLNVVGEHSLIQATVERLSAIVPPERIWVLTNDHLRDIIVEQLPGVPKRQILAEPAQRNTAPAIGLAAQVLHSLDPKAVMGVFPSDHVIARPPEYRKVVRAAYRGAAGGRLMVVGIQPRWPETGYGYIEFPRDAAAGGALPLPVRRFHEKPALAKAKRYLKAGHFYWNSGMFFWPTGLLLEELRRHLPRTATVLASLPPIGSRRFAAALERAFPLCDNISIDFAVMEKAAAVHGIAAGDFGWNDVGSWNAVYELLARDANGNAIELESLALDARDNFVDARGKFVALVGVRDLIVVDTPDALLVAARDRAQQVGDVVKALEKRNRHDLL
ncbi:MAG: mannose-1-phosphate guanylyltransferase [Acidobacteriota bacterium]|nr:mannose-1-phosphate guanylyltransferase [Acidobacteriota bacterium]